MLGVEQQYVVQPLRLCTLYERHVLTSTDA
jgi:hypothetical protein